MLDICDGALKLTMDELADKFDPVNVPVALACDGNRRGELNKIKKSKGFDWGSGAVSCAYWKGALLSDVLRAAGVRRQDWNGARKWVNFEGADDPSEGKYQTCIPLDYALDPANDVMLAYEMVRRITFAMTARLTHDRTMSDFQLIMDILSDCSFPAMSVAAVSNGWREYGFPTTKMIHTTTFGTIGYCRHLLQKRTAPLLERCSLTLAQHVTSKT